MVAIEIKNIQKSFGKRLVLKNISLSVQKGEIFTLLGENGAGKSTLINILATLSSPNHGSVDIMGLEVAKHPNEIRKLISLNAQSTTLDDEFTGLENLKLIATLRGLNTPARSIKTISQRLDLNSFINRKVNTYSGGMRRRLDLAMSLLGDPAIIFLDEPTTGVDPKNRLEIWAIIREMRDAGKTVFLTTQYLDEADQLSDHIGFIKDGEIVRYGTPKEIKQSALATSTLTTTEESVGTVQTLLNHDGISFTNHTSKFIIGSQDVQTVLSLLIQHQVAVLKLIENETTLETVFLNLTQKEVVLS